MAAINLKNIPEPIHKYLLKVQWEIKSSKKVSQYSLQSVVYGIIEEHERQNKKPSEFDLLNCDVLFGSGWIKKGSSSYVRGDDVIMYNGTNWFCNGELMTEQNYKEKIK